MNQQNFSAEDSLRVIQSMIEKAKDNVKDNGFYFLMWGWLVFIAALLNFVLIKFTDFERPYLAWNLMWIGVIISIIRGIRGRKKELVKTYLGETMKYFGISQGIMYAGLAFIFGYYYLWEQAFPFYILLYGVTCFFMGSLLQFKLLKWTSLLCLPIMISSVFFSFQWQLLHMDLAVLVSYIIPGHILSAKEKSQNK
jgi:hypothetical protein